MIIHRKVLTLKIALAAMSIAIVYFFYMLLVRTTPRYLSIIGHFMKGAGSSYDYIIDEKGTDILKYILEEELGNLSVLPRIKKEFRVYGESSDKSGIYISYSSLGDDETGKTDENSDGEGTSESTNGENVGGNSGNNTGNTSGGNSENATDAPSTEISTENETLEGEGDIKDVITPGKQYVRMPESIGTTYSLAELKNPNQIISRFYTVPSSTKLLPTDVEIDEVMSYDFTMKQDPSKPQILIYHTHSLEGYVDSVYADKSTNIVAVGEYLATILREQFGYHVIHCTESFDYIDGVADRSKAYTYARKRLISILEENPSIEVMLDVHRDGVDESIHFQTEVNAKKTAKIMFFNGLCRNSSGSSIDYYENKYVQENLAMSLQMKLLAEEYYPGFTRKNYVNAFHYNMNLRAKSMLIEVGAQTNTLEEAKNAMEPLAVLLHKLLN